MGKTPCCDKNGLKKGPWTADEDQKLIDYIQKHGQGRWQSVPKNAGLKRCGKSCRLRWTNYLRPDIKRGRFSFEEEETIIQLHSILGNKWSAIAARLPGRTDNEIKNYWNTHIRKKLRSMGIDPVTHTVRLDLLQLSTLLCNSSQLNFQSLLGPNPAPLNPNHLALATCPYSSQSKNHHFLPQNHLVQNTIQEFLACTAPKASSGTLANDTQFMKPYIEAKIFPNTTFLIQNNDDHWSNIDLACSSLADLPEYYNQSFTDLLFEDQMFQPNNNKSTTDQNLKFVNEGERDSYCSNTMMFATPRSFGNDGLM